MKILGISAFYHDSAAALLDDGRICAAAQEERFTRVKHDSRFPRHAIEYCLQEAGCSLRDVDYVVFYEKPFLKFERLIETYLTFAPSGFCSFQKAMPVWLKNKLFQKDNLIKTLKEIDPTFHWKDRLLFSEHHLSHAASAFYPSPFDSAVVLTMDGVGEWATTSVALGEGDQLKVLKEIHFPHSLGLLYSAFTYYIGFKVNSGEYKVMGLAPYGVPKYVDLIFKHLLDVKSDGSFRLNQEYFNYCTGLTMVNERFAELFGQPVRQSEAELTQFHMDVAASIQKVTEEIVLKLTNHLAKETGQKNLCLAGGVALNCVANGKILRQGRFENIWIQPAAGDAGGALGAAFVAHHLYKKKPRQKLGKSSDAMQGSYLGPQFSQNSVEERLKDAGARITVLSDADVINRTVTALAEEKAIGWMQGRMEFGPRALGGRSILADPRSTSMQKLLNLKVKFRESFRPFAPSVLSEDASNWFELQEDSPYMLLVADVHDRLQRKMTTAEEALFGIDKLNVVRSEIPAITHVDYSARVQTVHKETNPRYHALLSGFKEQTNCPVLVNTSFNIRGEPIVCSPEDAFRCFMGTDIEILVVENCFLLKQEQDIELRQDYRERFALD
ncbi:MAG: carbamoyltransferase [Pseudomonadota bacterium]